MTLCIVLAQINPVVGDLPYNIALIRRIRDGATKDTDLIIFPEMAVCGYPPEDLVMKPAFLAAINRCVKELAAESRKHGICMIVPTPMQRGGKIYNALHLIGGGKIIATRKKRHLPNYGVFDEARLFARGPLPAPVPFRGCNLGLMICEDMWKPDVAAHLKKKGTDILITVNASPYEVGKNAQRLELARERVVATGLPLIYVNQCGGQDELVFDGASFVLDRDGRIVAQAVAFAEDIRPTLWTREGKKSWQCRPGKTTPVPKGASSIYAALVTGLRDYVGKNGFPGVLIGISGGIDSALSAAIAADALGPERVRGVMMPSRYTARISVADAATLAKNLGIRLDTIPIENPVGAFEKSIAPFISRSAPGTVNENIQSRSRGVILMALSNATGLMVLSTGNKSEMAVGYATLYGDMCGGFNVLKDIYKTQVYELSRWRNGKEPVIPERILTRPPSAELKPDQTDQDTLPPYDVLDSILRNLIEEERSVTEIAAAGHDTETILKVWHMLDQAEYKRRQAAPGVKITPRAFGRDRRYPITNRFRISGTEAS